MTPLMTADELLRTSIPHKRVELVVEILSPHDRPGETLAKVGDWLEGSAQLVWLIDPERRLMRINVQTLQCELRRGYTE
ncbi:MAG: Uma2 family endonuclease [Gemmatimonadales bacterium]